MLRLFQNIGLTFVIAGKRFFNEGFFYRAAALAYTTLLAIVPLLTVSFTILTAFPAFQGIADNIKDFLFSHFVATSAQTIQTNVQAFINRASQSSPQQILVLLGVAILLVFNIERAFNAAWRVRRARGWTSAFLLYWAVITVTPLLLGAGLAISSYILSLPLITETAPTLYLRNWGLTLAPYGLSFAGFTLLYLIVPNRHVPLRFALFGGIVAMILFEGVKLGFAIYITNFPRYSVIYGALATVVIFLVWLYVSWLVTLYGVLSSRVAYELSRFTRVNQQRKQES